MFHFHAFVIYQSRAEFQASKVRIVNEDEIQDFRGLKIYLSFIIQTYAEVIFNFFAMS